MYVKYVSKDDIGEIDVEILRIETYSQMEVLKGSVFRGYSKDDIGMMVFNHIDVDFDYIPVY